MTNATKPHTFNVGDRAIYKSPNTRREIECTIKENVEGWWLVEWGTQTCDIIRPSELSPADPVPDAATLLVRELCAVEAKDNFPEHVKRSLKGDFDNYPPETAFAKYVRENPPLTVEKLETVMRGTGFSGERLRFVVGQIHAALTEQPK